MELRQLEHFIAAAEERHFTRAARRSNIVQSGLSASIRQLETELGTPLFVRTTRQVDLTAAGQVFLEEARRILATVRAARQNVEASKGVLRGALNIGVMQRWPRQVNLPSLLQTFNREHPGVDIRLRQGGSTYLIDEVKSGHLDLAFAIPTGPSLRGVSSTVLAQDSWVMACNPSHPLAERAHISVRGLADEQFIDFPRDWAIRALVDRAFAAEGIERHITFEMNEVTSFLELVAHGLGICILPRFVVAGDRKRFRSVPLRPALPAWELLLVTPATTQRSPAAIAFEQLIRKTLVRA